jgi:hypothetical protein
VDSFKTGRPQFFETIRRPARAFSSREPVSTSLENALALAL